MDIISQLKKFFAKNQFPLLIFFGLSILISIIFPTGFSIRYSYQLDDIAREPIIAPFDFGILKTVAKRMDISMDKMYVNIHKYGNTTAGTIPIAMCEALAEGKFKKGDIIVLTAFGAGYTWASSIIRW